MNGILVSVIVSFRNEQDVLKELVSRLHSSLGIVTDRYELIFVNDASTDGSLELLKTLSEEDPRVKFINMSRTFGVSQCALAGLAYSSGDAAVTIDADLQDPPELIPELIEKWREGSDVVYTVRKSRAGEPSVKLTVTHWAYKVLRVTSDIDLPVESGDFKLISRRVVDELVRLNEKDPFLRGLVRWVGFKQTPVYYSRAARFAGKSHFRFYGKKAVWNFVSGLVSFSLLPLHGALALGFAVSTGAFLYLLGVFLMKYLGWNLPGWSAIMATVLFLGGTQLITIGVLGIYLGKIYEETKDRPNYIVESLHGFETRVSGAMGFDREPVQNLERPRVGSKSRPDS
jgi:glycosyltransferase involved in cell wall biosynthesis